MKYILLVPDGVADEPYENLQGKTPLEVSRIPNLNRLAKEGRVGLCDTIPDRMEPGSDVGNLSILGYNPKDCYTGRAPLEAASQGILLGKGEVAFRVNFVTEAEGRLVDYSAGHISTQESHKLIEYLNEKLANDTIRFYPGVSYRNLAVVRDRMGLQGLCATCDPPHDIMGEEIGAHWPKGPGEVFLKKVMLDGRLLLHDHEINQIRIDLKENPANMVWFWGQGVAPQLQRFSDKYQVKGSVISAVDIVRGIGKLAGLEVIDVPGITGWFDTNYEGKVEYGLKSLEKKDFVLIHVEATDEAGHQGDVKLKISAIEDFDRRVVGPVSQYCEKNPETKVLVIPDHATSCKLRTHVRGPVPFLLYGKGVEPDEIDSYSESKAKCSDLRFEKGHELMTHFLRS
jgi:2,3-bisphosphoglycerate-independent phosphoglycerate mutase